MTFSDILTLIGSYCFPIVMCIAFFWKLNKDQEAHKEEIDKLSTALNNNTLVLQQVLEQTHVLQQILDQIRRSAQ